jgi:anti-sigma-K factor RskA
MTEREHLSGTHDCGGDAAAYVLGALHPAEAEAYERHLQGCAVCRDEIASLEPVVQALPMAAPQYPAPRRLRQRVLRVVREEASSRKGAAAAWRGPAWAWRWAALAGACAVAAGAVFAGVSLSGGRGARVIRAQVAGISGTAMVRVAGGRGELIVHRLSPPPPGKVYELWLKRGSRAPAPTNVLFTVTSAGAADVGLPPALHGVTEVLVTPEPKGGSRVPTHAPVIVARLT